MRLTNLCAITIAWRLTVPRRYFPEAQTTSLVHSYISLINTIKAEGINNYLALMNYIQHNNKPSHTVCFLKLSAVRTKSPKHSPRQRRHSTLLPWSTCVVNMGQQKCTCKRVPTCLLVWKRGMHTCH